MSSWFIIRANVWAWGIVRPGPTPRLPQGFTELAWIQTDGNAYISTGNTLHTSSDDVEIDFYIPGTSYIFGARSSTTNKAYCLQQTSAGNWFLGFGNASYTSSSSAPAGRYTAFINHVGGVLEIDGSTVISAGDASITTAYNCTLFRVASKSTYQAASGLRVYSFKHWRSDVLLKELVPAKRDSDDAIGMYDLVSDAFLTSDVGSFSYGSL